MKAETLNLLFSTYSYNNLHNYTHTELYPYTQYTHAAI